MKDKYLVLTVYDKYEQWHQTFSTRKQALKHYWEQRQTNYEVYFCKIQEVE